MTSMEMAAWAQALGSVLAVGAGFWLYFVQQKHARDARYRALFSMVHMTIGWGTIIDSEGNAAVTTSDWGRVMDDGSKAGISIRRLFDRIDLSIIESEAIWTTLTSFWVAFDELSYALEAEVKHAANTMPNAPVPSDHRAKLLSSCDNLQSAAQTLREKLTS